MNKVCRLYVSQVKAMLPLRGKNERKFVKKLHAILCDYCEDNNITTIEELYKGYGIPQEIVYEYISIMEPDVISRRINTARYIKIFVVSFIILILLTTTYFSFHTYFKYKIAEDVENFSVENVIEYN